MHACTHTHARAYQSFYIFSRFLLCQQLLFLTAILRHTHTFHIQSFRCVHACVCVAHTERTKMYSICIANNRSLTSHKLYYKFASTTDSESESDSQCNYECVLCFVFFTLSLLLLGSNCKWCQEVFTQPHYRHTKSHTQLQCQKICGTNREPQNVFVYMCSYNKPIKKLMMMNLI